MERVRTVDYLAYLLRLWREDRTSSWRAMLVNPHTGERLGFADLSKLFSFLQDLTAGGELDLRQDRDSHS
jgi:hypothetical protein